jgi:hypothetical protein
MEQGKRHTAETKARISEAVRQALREGKGFQGKRHSAASKTRMSLSARKSWNLERRVKVSENRKQYWAMVREHPELRAAMTAKNRATRKARKAAQVETNAPAE